MPPTYTVTVQYTDDSSPISGFICSIRTVEYSLLACQGGIGGTISEAIDDFRHRVTMWLAYPENHGFSDWPTPLTDISEIKNVIRTFSWTPE